MSRRSCQGLILLGVGLVCYASPVQAADRPLPISADLQPLSPSIRTGGPILCELALDWRGDEIFEAVVEITVLNGLSAISKVRRDDLVLTTGRRSVFLALPPPGPGETMGGLEVAIDLLHNGKRIPLQRRPLLLNRQQTRTQLVAVVDDWRSRSASGNKISESLVIEQFMEGPEQLPLRTSTVRVEPDQLPISVVEFCAFDVVLLTPGGLAGLSEEQMSAMERWLRAGGGLIVEPPRNLKPAHLQFLNRLVETSGAPAEFAFSSDGELLTSFVDDQTPFRRVHVDWGRLIVLVPGFAESEVTASDQWRRTVAWLWRLRQDQQNAIARQGTWALGQAQVEIDETLQPYYRDQLAQLNEMPLNVETPSVPSGNMLLRALMPRDVSTVPMPLVALVLLLYVLAIGPGDYLLLGRLHMRKWTWVFFPAVTLFFALTAIGLSNHYLGQTDHRRSMLVFDIGEGAEPIRSTRMELLFSGGEQTVETPVRQAIRVPMDHTMLGVASDWQYQQYARNAAPALSGGTTIHHGRFPQVYTAQQRLPQWTPQLAYSLSIPAEPSPVQYDWTRIELGELKTEEGRAHIARDLVQAFGQGTYIAVLNQNQRWVIGSTTVPFGASDYLRHLRQHDVYGRLIEKDAFLLELSGKRETQRDFFDLFSQLAPGGGAAFDDLAVFDSSAPGQWLLLVTSQSGDDIQVHRKLFIESSS